MEKKNVVRAFSLRAVAGLCVVAVSVEYSAAQADRSNEPDIQRRLEMIERGQEEAVKAELPNLLTNFQNHPGVLFLQAVLTTDGTEAVKI
jgi:hypothetical protein